MKTYVFITRRVSEIGGVEQYIYNKSRYLESQGWRVFVFSARKGPILIEGLKRFKDDVYPALAYAPECYSKREVRKTVDRLAARIGDCGNDPCVIQSDAVNRAIWAELLAKRLQAKHLAFILQEEHGYDPDTRQFLRFKYDRHELAGITAGSVIQMLDDETVEPREDTKIQAFCGNVVEDCPDQVSDRLDANADRSFGSLGRLEKPCVPVILKGFKQYFAAHPDEKFNLVMIGGAPDEKTAQRIREEMNECKNVRLIMTGNMYPVPLGLLRHIDVFVSAAGSSRATYLAGRPTVRVDPVTGKPVGVIGLDFGLEDKSMFASDPDTTIRECIERALENADRISYADEFRKDYDRRMRAEYDRQLSFADVVTAKEYYDEKLLMRLKTAHIHNHFAHWISGHLVGGDGIEHLKKIRKRIRK